MRCSKPALTVAPPWDAKATGVPLADIPSPAWLTGFEDSASPRPGAEEVFFEPSADKSAIRPPDRIVYYNSLWIPLDCAFAGVLLVTLIVGVVVGKRLGRRAS